jgi:hypothetical protein
MTNKLVAAAGVLSLVLGVAHVFGGGVDVHDPLLSSEIAPLLKGYVSVIWHSVTVAIFLCSGLLLIAAKRSDLGSLLAGIVIVYYGAFAGLFLFYGIARLGSVLLMPQWTAFLIIAALAAVGLTIAPPSSKSGLRH